MPAISAGDLVLLRTTRHQATFYLSIFRPASVMTALVNDATIARGEMDVIYDTGAGTFASVLANHTLWVGSSAGAYDKGRVRIRSIAGAVGAGTVTVAQNSIDWADGDYLTFKQEFLLWPRWPRIASGIFYKDYNVTYSDQNAQPPPVARMNIHRAGFLSGGSLVFDLDGTDSYAIAPGATISTYAWSATAGAIAAAAASTTTITFSAANADGEIVTLTVTDSNGKTQTTHRVMFPHSSDPTDSEYPEYDFEIDSPPSADWNRGGWTARFKVFGDADETNYPDGTLVVLWQNAYYGATNKNISTTEEVLFAGYLRGETVQSDSGTNSTSFEATTIQDLLKRHLMWSISLETVAGAPSYWYEYGADYLTTRRAAHHLWKWHSTLFEVAEVILPDSTLLRKFADFEGDLYSQVEIMAGQHGIAAHVACNKAGALYLEQNIQTLSAADRAAITVIAAITDPDRRDQITINVDPPTDKQTAMIQTDGFAFDGTTNTPLVSKAPGNAPETTGTAIVDIKRQVLDDQAQSNEIAGRFLAIRNNPYKAIAIAFSGNYFGYVDIVPQEWWTLSLVAADTNREIVWTDVNLIARSITAALDFAGGSVLVDARMSKEAEGPDGITGDYPTTAPDTGGDDEGIAQPLILTGGSVYGLADYMTPGSWTLKSATATEWLEVDPWWQTTTGTDDVTSGIIFQSGVGYIYRSTDSGDTWSDVTPTVVPPNKWSDTPAPVVGDLTFKIIQSDVLNQNHFKAIATWQDSGNWRSLTLWSPDNGTNWYYTDWWLVGGLDPADVVGAYQAAGAASLVDSYVNLNDPGTDDLTVGVAPMLDADGWDFTGSEYLIAPSLDAGADTAIVVGETPSSGTDVVSVGVGLAANSYSLFDAASGPGGWFFKAQRADTSNANLDTSVVNAAHINYVETSTGDWKHFLAGDATHETIATGGTPASGIMFVGARRNSSTGVAEAFSEATIGTVALYQTRLTATQAEAIAAHMKAIQDAY